MPEDGRSECHAWAVVGTEGLIKASEMGRRREIVGFPCPGCANIHHFFSPFCPFLTGLRRRGGSAVHLFTYIWCGDQLVYRKQKGLSASSGACIDPHAIDLDCFLIRLCLLGRPVPFPSWPRVPSEFPSPLANLLGSASYELSEA